MTEKPLTIAILGTRGVPNRYGGFEQCAEKLGVGLAELGHRVMIYNPGWHPYESNEYKGVQIVHKWCPERKLGAMAHFIYDFICLKDALRRGVDIVLELGYGTAALSYVLLRRKKAIIVTNMDGMEWMRAKWGRFTCMAMRWFEKLGANKSDYLIADNPAIQSYLSRTYGKDSSFIPYGANVFDQADESMLRKYEIKQHCYFLVIARFEPENNVLSIIEGYRKAKSKFPLLVVGGISGDYGLDLAKRYADANIRFVGPEYDIGLLNNLRYFSKLYFHGHSVGGTNPSLLEAMASGANIRAHDNVFNRHVLGDEACYFSNSEDVKSIIESAEKDMERDGVRIQKNYELIRNIYSWDIIIEQYEELFLGAMKLNMGS